MISLYFVGILWYHVLWFCVQLNFQGVTVERSRPWLHLASKQHVFTSVTIGDCAPPIQVCVESL